MTLLWILKVSINSKEKEKMDLFITKQHDNFANEFLKDNKIKKNDLVIGISPAATKDPQEPESSRVWPTKNYTDLTKSLIDAYGAKIIFFGSRPDVSVIENIRQNIKEKTYSSAGRTTIKQAAALIKRCKIFITHDCGLMHVASAMDVPVVSIFGPTDPRRKAPLNKGSVYITKDTFQCQRCEVFGKFPYCNKHSGTDLIEVVDVLKEIKKIIG